MTYELYKAVGVLTRHSQGAITMVQTFSQDVRGAGGVPEPATWTMMILGFGGAGALLRRAVARRRPHRRLRRLATPRKTPPTGGNS